MTATAAPGPRVSIHPHEIRKGDLIRKEYNGHHNTMEYTALHDGDGALEHFECRMYLLHREAKPLPTEPGSVISWYSSSTGMTEVAILPPTHETSGRWATTADYYTMPPEKLLTLIGDDSFKTYKEE